MTTYRNLEHCCTQSSIPHIKCFLIQLLQIKFLQRLASKYVCYKCQIEKGEATIGTKRKWLETLKISKKQARALNGLCTSWIQNMAEPRRNGRVGKVLELSDPCFHAAIAVIWNAITVVERFCRIATETEIAIEITF